MKKDIFIGGAWPYANYYLHVGHLAALLPGDIIARYYRAKGDNVIYVSGTDCHGTPITERAKKDKTTPLKVAQYYHQEFEKTFQRLNFSYDNYSSTMSPHHKDYVQKIFLKIMENGYIYEKEVSQDFCEKCNNFLSDREIEGICPVCSGKSSGEQCDECLTSLDSDKVLDKHCKTCQSKTIVKNNKHLYFKLSAFEKNIQELINSKKNTWRKNALGEAQKYIDMGLIDRAATRQLDWGIEVPVKGYEDKRIYVWIEAVLGYLSVGKEAATQKNINFDQFMSKENQNLKTYYVHGKDNIPFHTIIFPALLEAIKDNYQLPDYIISSAYVNLGNEKMSKSKGNLYTVNDLLETFSSDTLRFYFIFNGPELKDTNCSIEEMVKLHNKFLVGVLGNFINRNIAFINKKFNGVSKVGKIDHDIIDLTKKTIKDISLLIEKGELKNALNAVMEYISLGNKYYDSKQPWILVNENITDFNNTTYTCMYMIANISNLIAPFMVDTSLKIKKMLKLPDFKWQEISITEDIIISNNELLFEKIDNPKNVD